jgi:hypothetical protein
MPVASAEAASDVAHSDGFDYHRGMQLDDHLIQLDQDVGDSLEEMLGALGPNVHDLIPCAGKCDRNFGSFRE